MAPASPKRAAKKPPINPFALIMAWRAHVGKELRSSPLSFAAEVTLRYEELKLLGPLANVARDWDLEDPIANPSGMPFHMTKALADSLNAMGANLGRPGGRSEAVSTSFADRIVRSMNTGIDGLRHGIDASRVTPRERRLLLDFARRFAGKKERERLVLNPLALKAGKSRLDLGPSGMGDAAVAAAIECLLRSHAAFNTEEGHARWQVYLALGLTPPTYGDLVAELQKLYKPDALAHTAVFINGHAGNQVAGLGSALTGFGAEQYSFYQNGYSGFMGALNVLERQAEATGGVACIPNRIGEYHWRPYCRRMDVAILEGKIAIVTKAAEYFAIREVARPRTPEALTAGGQAMLDGEARDEVSAVSAKIEAYEQQLGAYISKLNQWLEDSHMPTEARYEIFDALTQHASCDRSTLAWILTKNGQGCDVIPDWVGGQPEPPTCTSSAQLQAEVRAYARELAVHLYSRAMIPVMTKFRADAVHSGKIRFVIHNAHDRRCLNELAGGQSVWAIDVENDWMKRELEAQSIGEQQALVAVRDVRMHWQRRMRDLPVYVLGAGPMGRYTVKGFLELGLPPEQIHVVDPDPLARSWVDGVHPLGREVRVSREPPAGQARPAFAVGVVATPGGPGAWIDAGNVHGFAENMMWYGLVSGGLGFNLENTGPHREGSLARAAGTGHVHRVGVDLTDFCPFSDLRFDVQDPQTGTCSSAWVMGSGFPADLLKINWEDRYAFHTTGVVTRGVLAAGALGEPGIHRVDHLERRDGRLEAWAREYASEPRGSVPAVTSIRPLEARYEDDPAELLDDLRHGCRRGA